MDVEHLRKDQIGIGAIVYHETSLPPTTPKKEYRVTDTRIRSTILSEPDVRDANCFLHTHNYKIEK